MSIARTIILVFGAMALSWAVEAREAVSPTATPTPYPGTEDWSHANRPEAVAEALHVPVQTVVDAYAADLAGPITWVVAKLAAACNCPVSDVMKARKTRSWGEVAALYGQSWVQLATTCDQLQADGVLVSEPVTRRQLLRTAANDPDSLREVRP